MLDENSIPPHYALGSSENESWERVEPMLRAAIDRLGSTDPWLSLHTQSLTEREARLAIDSCAKAFAVLRSIEGIDGDSVVDRPKLFEENEESQARLRSFLDYVKSAVPHERRIELEVKAAVASEAVISTWFLNVSIRTNNLSPSGVGLKLMTAPSENTI